MCAMEWNNDNVIKFLELYKERSLFWDTTNVWHKNKYKICHAWLEIQSEMGDSFSVQELRKKKESLMSMYRKCKTKVKKSELEGKDVYEPTGFAYPLMDSFLGTVYKCSLSVKDEDKSMADSIYVNDNSRSSCSDVESDPLKHQELMPTPKAFKRKRFLTQTTKEHRLHDDTTSTAVSSEASNGRYDECLLFSKLVAVKLRKVPEERRDFIMLKINEIFYNESQERSTLTPNNDQIVE